MQIEIIPQSVEIVNAPDGMEALKLIERVGRVSHRSEDRITDGSAQDFVRRRLYDDHHDSLLEHASFTARIVCDRAVANEITRHRVASFCQESTRYVNYGKGSVIRVIVPDALRDDEVYLDSLQTAANVYEKMVARGVAPELARSALPLALASELYMTANLREWRHFFRLRTNRAAHPQMRQLAQELLCEARDRFPVVFDEI